MARSDIHRPSAPEFDPEDYDFLTVTDLTPGDNGFGDGGGRVRREIVNDMIAQGYRFSPQYNRGQCTHCGAWIRYEALMAHRPTRTMVSIGEQCLGNRFELSAEQFATHRRAAAAQAKATREANARSETKAAVLAWLADAAHPLLVELSYRGNGGTADGNDFVWDIARKLFEYGELTDRQTAAVIKAITRQIEWAARDEERAREDATRKASASPAPLGRVEVSGTVERTWTKDTEWGMATKWRVVSPDGWVVIGTVPAALLRETDRTALPGQSVSFVATLSLGRDDPDPTVAFANRSTKARLLSPA